MRRNLDVTENVQQLATEFPPSDDASKRVGILLIGLALTLLPIRAPLASKLPDFGQVRDSWRPSEAYLLDRQGAILHEQRVDPSIRRLPWTALGDISPALRRSVIFGEDRRFFRHHGVDWRATGSALWASLTGGRPRGASTISMQVAAMLDPKASGIAGRRSLRTKAAQMWGSWTLEQTWSKSQILEAYLNLVFFRGELQGVGAAARGLFGKAPEALDEAESFLLTALLPSPQAQPQELAHRACRLAQAADSAFLCTRLYDLARTLVSRPPHAARISRASHLARLLLKTPGESVSTTLDTQIQTAVQQILDAQLALFVDRNVRDGAALVADNASGEVIAYVGSAGSRSRAPHNDGVQAPRQAGSTLKPFLYALALERRYLTAASLLDDSPVQLTTQSGLYIPQNYDREFKGLVSVRTALSSSLNIPAVRTLSLVGIESFLERLRALGYAHITRDGDYYGFSLALGSAEVTLLEQVNAFRTIANQGILTPLRFTLEQPASPPRRVIATDASYVIADVLSDRASRAVTFGLDSPLSTRFWSAVKTGTSKDLRDNWCIGFSQRYTVGVWVGNFEGDSMSGISGISGAAPVWRDIMEILHAATPEPTAPPQAPPGLIRAQIEYEPSIEPPRFEWFLSGTDGSPIIHHARGHARPHIAEPPAGVVIAWDPDIPPVNQALAIAAVADPDMHLDLDGQTLGPASRRYRWQLIPGAHRLRLIGSSGGIVDTVDFRVRATSFAPHNEGVSTESRN